MMLPPLFLSFALVSAAPLRPKNEESTAREKRDEEGSMKYDSLYIHQQAAGLINSTREENTTSFFLPFYHEESDDDIPLDPDANPLKDYAIKVVEKIKEEETKKLEEEELEKKANLLRARQLRKEAWIREKERRAIYDCSRRGYVGCPSFIYDRLFPSRRALATPDESNNRTEEDTEYFYRENVQPGVLHEDAVLSWKAIIPIFLLTVAVVLCVCISTSHSCRSGSSNAARHRRQSVAWSRRQSATASSSQPRWQETLEI